MYILQLLYALLVSGQKTLPNGMARYYPFLLTMLSVLAIVDPSIRLVLQFSGFASILSQINSVIWVRMDGTYMLSGALSALIAWRFFDARRTFIQQKFSKIPPVDIHMKRLATSFGSLLLFSTMAFASFNYQLNGLIFSFLLLTGLSVLARRYVRSIDDLIAKN